jgi:hypothetical protein
MKTTAPQVIVGEVVAGEAHKAKKQLEGLIKFQETSNFDIATLCYTIKRKSLFHPFTTFQDYYKTLTKIKPRKIQYLTRMAEVMDKVGIPREVYEPLGISRLREITSLDPDGEWTNPNTKAVTPLREFIVGFVEAGESITPEQLKNNVKTLKGLTGENDIVWWNVPFTRSAFENTITPALELSRANIGSVGKDDEGISKDASDSTIVEAWAADVLADPSNQAGILEGEQDEEPAESDE